MICFQSWSGKTERAKHLVKHPLELKIARWSSSRSAQLQETTAYDGLVLDDVRMPVHQDKLQGNYDCLVEFGSTADGTWLTIDLFDNPRLAGNPPIAFCAVVLRVMTPPMQTPGPSNEEPRPLKGPQQQTMWRAQNQSEPLG